MFFLVNKYWVHTIVLSVHIHCLLLIWRAKSTRRSKILIGENW